MKYLYGGIFSLKAELSKLEGYRGECTLWNKGKLAYFDTERQAREAQRKRRGRAAGAGITCTGSSLRATGRP